MIIIFFGPPAQSMYRHNTLRKWNNGLQRASWRWTCFEMRPHSPSVVPRTAAAMEQKVGHPSIACNVVLAVRLPISCTSSTAWWCHVYPLCQWPPERTHECYYYYLKFKLLGNTYLKRKGVSVAEKFYSEPRHQKHIIIHFCVCKSTCMYK